MYGPVAQEEKRLRAALQNSVEMNGEQAEKQDSLWPVGAQSRSFRFCFDMLWAKRRSEISGIWHILMVTLSEKCRWESFRGKMKQNQQSE